MKRIGVIVAIGALAAASAYAQQTFEPAVPRGLPDSRTVPSGQPLAPQNVEPAVPRVVEPAVPRVVEPGASRTVAPAGPRLVMEARRGRRDADARQCLTLASNIQIHRCAERYRPHGSRAKVTKATARSSDVTLRRDDRAKSADLGKPDMSKAAEPAKPVDTTKAAPPPAPAAKAAEPAKAAAAPASGDKPKWSDNAKNAFTKGAQRADDATK